MTRIGILSDTHGHLDRQISILFQGVDHIFHAGDIGPTSILDRLSLIAPVTAVRGNTDWQLDLPETSLKTIAARKFLLHHIVSIGDSRQPISPWLQREAPDAVIFGHTHQAQKHLSGNCLYLNPGYAGAPRTATERSVAILTITPEQPLQAEIIRLGR